MKFYIRFSPTILLFALHSMDLFSQERVLGTWKSFMPYANSVAVCDAGDKIYCAAPKSVFSYEKNSGVIQIYDKATGLNDVGIKTMNYDPSANMLVIAYINSNIDFAIIGNRCNKSIKLTRTFFLKCSTATSHSDL